MRYVIRGPALGAAVAAACLAGTAATANAAPAQPGGLYAPSALVLAVGEGDEPAATAVRRAVTLSCSPSSAGTHPAPEEACAELRAADGEFASLTDTDGDRVCPMVWDPVTVTAEGVWEGRRVSYARTFPNPCVMEGATSAVFSF